MSLIPLVPNYRLLVLELSPPPPCVSHTDGAGGRAAVRPPLGAQPSPGARPHHGVAAGSGARLGSSLRPRVAIGRRSALFFPCACRRDILDLGDSGRPAQARRGKSLPQSVPGW